MLLELFSSHQSSHHICPSRNSSSRTLFYSYAHRMRSESEGRRLVVAYGSLVPERSFALRPRAHTTVRRMRAFQRDEPSTIACFAASSSASCCSTDATNTERRASSRSRICELPSRSSTRFSSAYNTGAIVPQLLVYICSMQYRRRELSFEKARTLCVRKQQNIVKCATSWPVLAALPELRRRRPRRAALCRQSLPIARRHLLNY